MIDHINDISESVNIQFEQHAIIATYIREFFLFDGTLTELFGAAIAPGRGGFLVFRGDLVSVYTYITLSTQIMRSKSVERLGH